ncbi:hypothetical protein PFISCL1PPCAC_4240, partial [Pristionchus fissidentatus]
IMFLRQTVVLSTLVALVRSSCTSIDHQACDELCKTDSFWYGHCIGWDGTDFSCTCFEYRAPLSGDACKPKQNECTLKCKETGKDGGFCYPRNDRGVERNRTGCECFKSLPQELLRRRRRHAMRRRSYKIVA